MSTDPAWQSEGDDGYCAVIIAKPPFRIIVCKDGHEWIIQHRAAGTLRQGAWRSLSRFARRESLQRSWRALTGDAATVELSHLPVEIGGGGHD